MKAIQLFLVPSLLVLFSVALSGCAGTKDPELVAPVTGIVNINGEPAAGIMVQFVPDITDESIVVATSQGLTDESGKFILNTTRGTPGAWPGPHRVTLVDTLEDRPAQGQESTVQSRLDPTFASKALKIEVKAGEQIVIEAK